MMVTIFQLIKKLLISRRVDELSNELRERIVDTRR